jgi:hypothetical protein
MEMDVLKEMGMSEQEAWTEANQLFILTEPDRSWLED